MSDSDRAQWDSELARTGSVTFAATRSKTAQLLFTGLVVTVLGAWLIVRGSALEITVGAAAIAFFGCVCVPVFAWRLVKGTPTVCVDRDGIAWGTRKVTWHEANGFKTWSRGGREGAAIVIIELTPDGANRLAGGRGPLSRMLDRLNRPFIGTQATWLPVTNAAPQAMAAWLESMRLDASRG